MKEIAEESNLAVGGADGFPKSSNWLWKKIVQVKPNLQALGIEANRERETNSNVISLSKILQKGEDASTMPPVPPSASIKNDSSQARTWKHEDNGSKSSTFRHTNEETIKYADKDNNFLVAESIRLRQKLQKASEYEKVQIQSDLEKLIIEGQAREMVYFLNKSQQDELINDVFSDDEGINN